MGKDSIQNILTDGFTGDFTQFDGQDIIFVGYGKRSVTQQLYGLKYKVTLTAPEPVKSPGGVP